MFDSVNVSIANTKGDGGHASVITMAPVIRVGDLPLFSGNITYVRNMLISQLAIIFCNANVISHIEET